MFGFLKKKDPYLKNVGAILHKSLGKMMPLENAYGLAEECLAQLRINITKGAFQNGPNPDEKMMAYYCKLGDVIKLLSELIINCDSSRDKKENLIGSVVISSFELNDKIIIIQQELSKMANKLIKT